MKKLDDFITELNEIIEITENIDKNSSQYNLKINFSEFSVFYNISNVKKATIISLLESYLVKKGKDKFNYVLEIISSKIDFILDFYDKYSLQLARFDKMKCIKSSLKFARCIVKDSELETNKVHRKLIEIRTSLESSCNQFDDNHYYMKELRLKEKKLEEKYESSKISLQEEYYLFNIERNKRIKYYDINFPTISQLLQSIQIEIKSKYNQKVPEIKELRNDLIFKPEIFGVCHRRINDLCDELLCENRFKQILNLSNVKSKIKLKPKVKEKLYFVVRQLSEFTTMNTIDKKEWEHHIIIQFGNTNLSTFDKKTNLLENDEKFRTEIEDEFLKLKSNYL